MRSEYRPCVAVIGLGRWGQNIVRVFDQMGALAAVCDTQDGLAEKTAEKYAVPAMTLEQILADDVVTCAVVATDTVSHAPLAKRLMEKGMDVWVEKPVSLDIDTSYDLCKVSDARRRICFIDYLMVYHSVIQRLRRRFFEKGIRSLDLFESQRLGWGAHREEGVVWDLMCHDLAIIQFLLPETTLSSFQLELRDNLSTGAVDYARLSFESDGGHFHCLASSSHPAKQQTIQIRAGSLGWSFFPHAPLEKMFHEHYLSMGNGMSEQRMDFEYEEPLCSAARAFMSAYETRVLPPTAIQYVNRVEDWLRRLMCDARVKVRDE